MKGRRLAAIAVPLMACSMHAQELFESGPGRRLLFHPSDHAILSGSGNRSDIGCSVEPQSPQLGFDLKYTAGYIVRVPAAGVSAGGERLRVLFRVRSIDGGKSEPVYFRQYFDIAASAREGGGTAVFPGRYVVGPGRYEVDWLMRNLQGRVCSSHWRTRAPTPGHTGRLAAAATANLIAPYREDTFDDEPPVLRRSGLGAGLHVALLVNLAPLDRNRFKLNAYEIDSVMGMLRSLHREPSIGLFSLTVFHAYDRQVVYSAERRTRLDFGAIGEAIESMPLGVVEVDALADEEGERRFLAEVLGDALSPEAGPRDAVVVLGPKVDREARLEDGMLEPAEAPAPVFQFAYNRNPRSYPWPGAIESALRPYGLTLFSVTSPRDFSRALEGLLEAIDGTGGQDLPTRRD